MRTADILERVTLGRVGFGLALQNRDLSTVGRKKLPGQAAVHTQKHAVTGGASQIGQKARFCRPST